MPSKQAHSSVPPNLPRVVLPDGLLTIGDAAFKHCVKLTDIILPDSLTAIGNQTFCYAPTSLVIPASVTAIGADVFKGCSNLVLTVTPGSYAELWCTENNLPFVVK